MFTTLIQAPELLALRSSGLPLLVFDCSFDLMQPALGREQYLQAHVAGARYAHLDEDLCAHGGSVAAGSAACGGRHPLPSRAAFAGWMRRHGITPATQVVVYDRQGLNFCGRLWWMLKWCGHEAVAVLDGGLQAWQQAGGEVRSGEEEPSGASAADSRDASAAAPVDLPPPRARLVTLEEVRLALKQPGQMSLVDARAAARFRGEVEPLDPVAGHIPGALNRPFGDNLDPNGRMKPASALRAEWEALLGERPPQTVVHHCGSGVSSVPNLLAMEHAGLGRTALYAGSWSEWCTTPGLPVATGSA